MNRIPLSIDKLVVVAGIIALIAFIICLLPLQVCNAATDKDSKSENDYGEVEVTILRLQQKPESKSEYGKVRINRIFAYFHDNEADYEPLTVGDEIDVNFQLGTAQGVVDMGTYGPTAEDIRLPGTKVEDKILVQIKGRPGGEGADSKWSLYDYSIVNKGSDQPKVYVYGKIASGKEVPPEDGTTPGPRYVYEVEVSNTDMINVEYEPGPADQDPTSQYQSPVRFSFHAGSIQIGDYVRVRGDYDKENQMVVPKEIGDYIETPFAPVPYTEIDSSWFSKTKTSTNLSKGEVKKLLIKRKHLATIDTIWLDGDFYNVSGTRKAKLLWLIPISIDTDLVVDAVTGEITSKIEPWWSFLAR